MQTPVAAQSEASVCGRSLVGIECSNPARDSGCLSVVSVACYQVEVSASDWSIVQRSPTKCTCVRARVCVGGWMGGCVCRRMWSDATITLYTCNKLAETS